MGGAKTKAMTQHPLTVHKGGPLSGRAAVPGDKSLSHRALIFGALAVGETRIRGLLESEDVLATARALAAMGTEISKDEGGVWHIWGRGVGGLTDPDDILDLGNSGTGVRLLMGVAAQQPIQAIFSGDASLQNRPMGRVIEPLSQMGVHFTAREGGRLPLTVTGPQRLRAVKYELPVPSAQVKSAILLAGLAAPGATTVIEPIPTRDHTERMAQAFGASVDVTEEDGHRVIRVFGQKELSPSDVTIAADPSSAAFVIVAALITPGSDVTVPGVLTNPTRLGFVETLTEMGGEIELTNKRDMAGEPIADIRVRASSLRGIDVPADRAASMIDEYPALSIAAAFAEGETKMLGLGELRIKESDRLGAIASGLKANGVQTAEGVDSLTVRGCGGSIPGGGTAQTHLDHRIAMAFLIAGFASDNPVTVDDGSMIATSFPNFLEVMAGLGVQLEGAAP